MKINDSTTITSVTMINMDDGIESELFEIKGSRCHFSQEFEYQDYIIQLRLDWDDLVNGDPKLDVDIWRKFKHKNNRLRKGPWHHAEKKFDSAMGRYIYTFEFENLRLRLGTKTTATKDMRCRINIVRPSRDVPN